MFVAKWEPGLTPETPELTAAPVWVDFHNVPPHFYSEEGLEHIAGLVGHPVVLHPNTTSMTNQEVARVFTIIDPTKPLPEAVNVRFQSGETQRVLVTSPWLPPMCEHCNLVGHSIKRCPSALITCTKCNSSAHHTDSCPRNKPPPKVAEVDPNRKKKTKKQRKHKTTLQEIPTLDGALEVDIGLDNLRKDTPSKVMENDRDQASSGSPTSDKSEASAKAEKAGRLKSARPSSSSSSEDSASTEAETSAYYSEEDSSSKEEEEYTTVLSKKKQKLLLNLQKKANANKANSSRGKRPKPQ